MIYYGFLLSCLKSFDAAHSNYEATVCGINEIIRNKMKSTKYLTVRTIAKSNIKIVERIKYDTPSTQTNNISITCEVSLGSLFQVPLYNYFNNSDSILMETSVSRRLTILCMFKIIANNFKIKYQNVRKNQI
jgi:hypothetical protein